MQQQAGRKCAKPADDDNDVVRFVQRRSGARGSACAYVCQMLCCTIANKASTTATTHCVIVHGKRDSTATAASSSAAGVLNAVVHVTGSITNSNIYVTPAGGVAAIQPRVTPAADNNGASRFMRASFSGMDSLTKKPLKGGPNERGGVVIVGGVEKIDTKRE